MCFHCARKEGAKRCVKHETLTKLGLPGLYKVECVRMLFAGSTGGKDGLSLAGLPASGLAETTTTTQQQQKPNLSRPINESSLTEPQTPDLSRDLYFPALGCHSGKGALGALQGKRITAQHDRALLDSSMRVQGVDTGHSPHAPPLQGPNWKPHTVSPPCQTPTTILKQKYPRACEHKVESMMLS